jgi:hypothetical protein
VPFQVAALHEPCAVLLQLREGQPRVPVVPPETGYPRASFRGSSVCPSALNLCLQPFIVAFDVSVVRSLSDFSSQDPPTLHVSQQLTHSTEPNLVFFDDPPSLMSTSINPRVLSSNRTHAQSLHYRFKSMTSGCGSLQLQLHFVTDGLLEHTTGTFIVSVPTWGKSDFEFHLLRESSTPSSLSHFDFSRQPTQCQPVNWDSIEHLSDHRSVVAAVELPSPFAIAFVSMMVVPPFDSRLEALISAIIGHFVCLLILLYL